MLTPKAKTINGSKPLTVKNSVQSAIIESVIITVWNFDLSCETNFVPASASEVE